MTVEHPGRVIQVRFATPVFTLFGEEAEEQLDLEDLRMAVEQGVFTRVDR